MAEDDELNVVLAELKNSDTNVRCIAIEKLLCSFDKVQDTDKELVLAALIEALEDAQYDVVSDATMALRKVGNAQTAFTLLAKLEKLAEPAEANEADINPDYNSEYALGFHYSLVIGHLGTKDMVAKLTELTTSPNLVIKASAIWALGSLGDASLIPHLLMLLAAKEPRIRRAAAAALGHVGRNQVIPILINVVDTDTDDMVREMAIISLGESDGLEVSSFLENLARYGTNVSDYEYYPIARTARLALAEVINRKNGLS